MIPAGSRLGPYEIGSLIGAGGMGEVYRARDTRLGRDVAIKVLPPDHRADEDRRRRFLQEAQSASALTHPHIVTIHEIESAGDLDFIVMEYVPGKSLDALIPRGGMRLSELLRIAIPVSDAAAAAHARGIVHRDLKPANVIVGQDGTVKVLDFGLAKLVGRDAAFEGDAVTRLADGCLSAPGTIAGTAAYMAPEQATGGTVDARSDIFSFGTMLYEMATGTRPFAGNSTAETLAAVIHTPPPPPAQLASALPRELERLILRCLRKMPERRYQTMLDVKLELQEISEESDSGRLAAPPAAPAHRSRGRLIAAAGAIVIIIAVAAWFIPPRGRRETPPDDSWATATPVPFTTFPGQEVAPAFSPDASQIAFAWSPEGPQDQFDLYTKVIGNEKPLRLTTHRAEFIYPAWSPDGRQIAFSRMAQDGDAIYLISPLGGPERKLADAEFDYFLGTILSWSPDGKFLAFHDKGPSGQLGISVMNVATLGKRWQPSPAPDCVSSWVPAFSPDGASLAFGCMMSYGVNDLYVAPASGGSARRIGRVQGDWTGMTWMADSRHLIFAAEGELWRIAASGDNPEKVMAGRDAAMPAVSRAGNRLAYTTQTFFNANIWEVRLAGPGRSLTPPRKLISSSKADNQPAFSPDGRRVAFASNRSGSNEIWTSDADGSNAAALTAFGGPWTGSPRWSPDGQLIAFDSRAEGRSNIYVTGSQGGPSRRIATGVDDSANPAWSMDGKWLYFNAKVHGVDQILKLKFDGGTPTQLTTHGGTGAVAAPSDPTRIYYTNATGMICSARITGGDERCLSAILRPSYELQGAWTLSATGIYFLSADVAQAVLHFFDFRSGKIVRVTDLPGRPLPYSANPALSPDGQRLVYTQLDEVASDIMLVDTMR